MRVLLSGATGFLGSELLRSLLLSPDVERVYALVRPYAGMSTDQRLQRLRIHWSKFVRVPSQAEWDKLQVITCDLATLDQPLSLDSQIKTFFHAAASTDLGAPLRVSRRANVQMTQQALAIGRKLRKLERFVHFSTAYVCGRQRGLIQEEALASQAFHNFYEQSKREAEDAVDWGGLPYTILRPSIIVGRSDDGYAHSTKVLYSVWRMWLSGLIPRAPIDPQAWVDIVPVDYVVRASLHLAQASAAVGGRYHLCAGSDRQSPKTIMQVATQAFGVPLPPISPPWAAYALRSAVIRPVVPHALREILDAMYWHLPYLGIRDRQFDMRLTDALLLPASISCPPFARYGATLFRFCQQTAWGKRALPNSQRLAEGLACSA